MILAACAWDPNGATSYAYNDEAGMPYAYHFSRAYSFLHDRLTEAERKKCREVMAIRGAEMYAHLMESGLSFEPLEEVRTEVESGDLALLAAVLDAGGGFRGLLLRLTRDDADADRRFQAAAAGLGAGMGALAFGPTRDLARRALPKPGEGPSPEAQEAGYFDVRLYGETADGRMIVSKVTGDRDPGYGDTRGGASDEGSAGWLLAGRRRGATSRSSRAPAPSRPARRRPGRSR